MLDRLHHAAPLHYLPSIIMCSALLPAADLAPLGIEPRSGAARRDRKLGLHAYVHLSPRFLTPLLRDKLKKGYAHGVFTFDAACVLALPEAAILPYNPKSWRHREDFLPVADSAGREKLLAGYAAGRFPSLEIVVKAPVPLMASTILIVRDGGTKAGLETVIAAAGGVVSIPIVVDSGAFGEAYPTDESFLSATMDYFELCRRERRLMPPPSIVFD